MIITMDFKEKMQLRRAPKELNRDFYFRQPLSVFGIQTIRKNPTTHKTERKYWDIVSYVLSNDAAFVAGALEEFTTDHLDEFQGISDIKLFTDKGPHFDNYEVAHLFLCHLPQKLNCHLSWHLWAAKHGKSEVDGHFGLLSRFYNEWTKKTRIDTMEQFIPEMQSAFEKDHLMKNVFILKYPAHLEVPETPKSISFLKFSGITDYHCFLSSPGSSQIILKTTSAESCPGHIITKVVGTRSNTHQIKLSYSKRTAEQSMEQEEQGTEYSPRLQKQARRQHQPITVCACYPAIISTSRHCSCTTTTTTTTATCATYSLITIITTVAGSTLLERTSTTTYYSPATTSTPNIIISPTYITTTTTIHAAIIITVIIVIPGYPEI
ncbi:hypothetical protein Pelo_18473 [Pelomyxa schiedti]|nr:hypothetical protein Pelo_18473 [Pelomyxa schiedti]